MNFSQAEAFLDSLINYERTAANYTNLKLVRFKRLLEDLNNPQKRLKNVILIAGTKGKGSVGYWLESALNQCGLRTGYFTKPHLISVCERIRVLTEPIPPTDFAQLIGQVKPLVLKHKCTYFETITAIAFLYFLAKDLDYTIIEVGLGGRLDATNVIKPIVAVITRIGLDHIEVLGDSVMKIAAEKAAIIHSNTYVVCAPQRPGPERVIRKRVKETNSELFLIGRDLKIEDEELTKEGSKFRIKWAKRKYDLTIPVVGRHQIENAATAIGVLLRLATLDARINWQGITNGFKQVKIPARCQIIRHDPLIILDVAHNPDSALALNQTIQDIFKRDVVLIFGANKEKLVKEMLQILLPITKKVIFTKAQSSRAYEPKDLVPFVKPYSIPFIVTDSVEKAIGEGLKKLDKDEMMVITGSFYVAGEAIKAFKIQP